jgi:hypothetical protein
MIQRAPFVGDPIDCRSRCSWRCPCQDHRPRNSGCWRQPVRRAPIRPLSEAGTPCRLTARARLHPSCLELAGTQPRRRKRPSLRMSPRTWKWRMFLRSLPRVADLRCLSRSGSFSGEPIMNLAAGMKPLAHSLKSEPGLPASAFSCSAVRTVGSIAMRQPFSCAMTPGSSIKPRLTRQSRTMRLATSTLPRCAHAANGLAAIGILRKNPLSSTPFRSASLKAIGILRRLGEASDCEHLFAIDRDQCRAGSDSNIE